MRIRLISRKKRLLDHSAALIYQIDPLIANYRKTLAAADSCDQSLSINAQAHPALAL
ncbi:hypothetical protein [Bradyrhizobium guangdongense]|uniref:hypothetical protein n=1 Tax=Bradyrhizobium guangdongense TaxID=1325090 RepID=UPI0013E8D0C4|nr:hypothetical protein [Bradyrhizobium guangdongense]